MPKIRDRELMPFTCTTCGKPVAWTAPGEAVRIGQRAAVYCEDCKDAPANLTPRQQEVIEVAKSLAKAIGKAPTLGEIGDAMVPPLSRSRVQSLAASIRLRGHGDALSDALYGGAAPSTAVSGDAIDVPFEFDPEHDVTVEESTETAEEMDARLGPIGGPAPEPVATEPMRPTWENVVY